MKTREITLITEDNVHEVARRPEIVALFTPLLQYGSYAADTRARVNGGPQRLAVAGAVLVHELHVGVGLVPAVGLLVRFYHDLWSVCSNRYYGISDAHGFDVQYDVWRRRLEAAQAWLAEFPMRVYSAAEIAALEHADIRIRTLTQELRSLYLAAVNQSARLPQALEEAWSLLEEETGEHLPEPGIEPTTGPTHLASVRSI